MTTRTEQLTVDGPVDLRVEATSADVVLRTSPDPGRVGVTLSCRDDAVDLQQCTVRADGRCVVVEVPELGAGDGTHGARWARHGLTLGGGSSAPVEVTVEVPEDGTAELSTRSGGLTATGRLARLRATSASGDVHVVGPAAVMARCSSGVIRVESAGEVECQTGSGDIHAAQVATLVAKTGSGDVVATSVESGLAVQTGSGDVRLDQPGARTVVRSGSGDIALHRLGAGHVQLTTASGQVEVGVSGGVPVWTDVTTVSGDLESRLTPRGEPAEGQAHLELVVRTVSGDVTLSDD